MSAIRHAAHLRDILDDADDAEALAIGLEGLADGVAAVEERAAVSCG